MSTNTARRNHKGGVEDAQQAFGTPCLVPHRDPPLPDDKVQVEGKGNILNPGGRAKAAHPPLRRVAH
ncbi:hypothetical protein PtA15_17A427 [Puccinia triticina]|uniref:Uncharacterized protein n=1 Tax=Puccinia triticina TaxID=208348 RepID=A0ABY7DAA7_9BASI|nr:uncharacterized protein PtA15_17A427 [Puccinia triticina]WAQ92945.1 hypothetical protein PtA15_17A427 [Puccinia triticina]